MEVANRDRHGDFNLCSPYGEHLEGKQQITIIDVSIHAPARGALGDVLRIQLYTLFQFTLPAWGAVPGGVTA